MQFHLCLLAALSWLVAATAASPIAPPPPLARDDSDPTELDISGPFSTGINCPTVYTWTGGAPPFTATFFNIDTGGLFVPVETHAGLLHHGFDWMPGANATGQMLQLRVTDERGDEGSFGIIIVSTQEVC